MRGFFKRFGIKEGGVGRPSSTPTPGFVPVNYQLTREHWATVTKPLMQAHLDAALSKVATPPISNAGSTATGTGIASAAAAAAAPAVKVAAVVGGKTDL
jgi:hypothetical protein